MTTTDFPFTEGPVGMGAGGNSPRRLIPSGFQPAALPGGARHWTDSPVVIATVLFVVALASLAAGAVLTDWGILR
jgi:hypothetical protein